MATKMDVYRRRRVVFAYFVYEYILKERNRKYWTHPLVSSRLLKGAFVTMFADIREDESKFHNYLRMSLKSFDELAAKLDASIKSKDSAMRLAIRGAMRLQVLMALNIKMVVFWVLALQSPEEVN
jgi:hypothetical protein